MLSWCMIAMPNPPASPRPSFPRFLSVCSAPSVLRKPSANPATNSLATENTSNVAPAGGYLDAGSSVSPLSVALTKKQPGWGYPVQRKSPAPQAAASDPLRFLTSLLPNVITSLPLGTPALSFPSVTFFTQHGPRRTFRTSSRQRPPSPKPFRMCTYEKLGCNPFRMNTSKTKDLKLFRMNTYEKTLGGSDLSSQIFAALPEFLLACSRPRCRYPVTSSLAYFPALWRQPPFPRPKRSRMRASRLTKAGASFNVRSFSDS